MWQFYDNFIVACVYDKRKRTLHRKCMSWLTHERSFVISFFGTI